MKKKKKKSGGFKGPSAFNAEEQVFCVSETYRGNMEPFKLAAALLDD